MIAIAELLREIRGRIPMYVGDNSLLKLAAFLRGYSYALERNQLGGDMFMAGFQQFVEEHFEVKVSRSWDAIIEFHAWDAQESVNKFWQIFDEFILLQGNSQPSTPG